MAKIEALKIHQGDYDAVMKITPEIKDDLVWWINNLPQQKRDITKGNAELSISPHASHKGWAGSCGHLKSRGR